MDCDNEYGTSTKIRQRNFSENSCCNENCNTPPPVTLECGFNPQDAIFEIRNGYVKEHQKFVLDRVRVDTCGFCRPIVKIEFSSLVCFEVEDETNILNGANSQTEEKAQTEMNSPLPIWKQEVEVELLFKLERTCKGITETIQTWKFKKEFEIKGAYKLEIEICEPFTVTFCDKSSSHCCEYRMVVEGKDFEGKVKALSVTKPDISALATGLCNS